MNCSIAKVRTTVSWLSIYKRETVGARVRPRAGTILLWIPSVGHLLPPNVRLKLFNFMMLFWHRQLCILLMNNAAQTQRIHHSRLTDNFQWIDFITIHRPKIDFGVLEIVWKIDKIHNVFITSEFSFFFTCWALPTIEYLPNIISFFKNL